MKLNSDMEKKLSKFKEAMEAAKTQPQRPLTKKEKVISGVVVFIIFCVIVALFGSIFGGRNQSRYDDLLEAGCTVYKVEDNSALQISCGTEGTIDVVLNGDELSYVRYKLRDEDANVVDYVKDQYMRIDEYDGSYCVYAYDESKYYEDGDCDWLFGTNSIENDTKYKLDSLLRDAGLYDDDDIVKFTKWVLDNDDIVSSTIVIDTWLSPYIEPPKEESVISNSDQKPSDISTIGNSTNLDDLSSNSTNHSNNQGQSSNDFSYDLNDTPSYSNALYIEVNGNVPFFTESELSKAATSYESYSPLDSLGRCGSAIASVGLDIMPTEDRGSISEVEPTGWVQAEYDGLIDGDYLYNRSHLIGFQLTGENANERNLITGTRQFNTEGMLPFENMVADYVKETGNHVLYRVTPDFKGSNLVASGVLMEAMSIEDDGEGIEFCVYVYNIQDCIDIDYSDGDSSLQSGCSVSDSSQSSSNSGSGSNSSGGGNNNFNSSDVSGTTDMSADYILNTNTMKFHYPSCSSVKRMSDKNKQSFHGTRDEVIAMGYDPCGNCNP